MSLILEYKVEAKDNGQSLGDFLKQQNVSKKAMISLKHRGGKIYVNDQIRTTRWQLHTKDRVRVIFPNEIPSHFLKPVKMDLRIVYEDDFLLVIDKEAGFPVMPTGNHEQALANGILAYYQKIGLASTVHLVNRLDKGTSGLLMVAKYRHIHHLMMANLGQTIRKYYAVVAGILNEGGFIQTPILRPTMDSIKRIVHEEGLQAVTHYQVMQRFEADTLVPCTLVQCILETGRTHQIRVHMSHLGHPILKDPIYGDGREEDHQLLHSYFLAFPHPITQEKLCFETEIPTRFGISK